MSDRWAIKMKENYSHLKRSFAMQSLANYIVLTMTDHEIDKLVPMLTDKTKQVHVEIYVTEKEQK